MDKISKNDPLNCDPELEYDQPYSMANHFTSFWWPLPYFVVYMSYLDEFTGSSPSVFLTIPNIEYALLIYKFTEVDWSYPNTASNYPFF
jgi:hypothetical protein